MGTRALIAVQQPDASFRSIYTHWDGYPSHHGQKLLKGYDTLEKANALMDLGDLSVLGSEIGEKQDFDAGAKGKDWCLAYGRDRGEKDVQSGRSRDLSDLSALTQERGGEYLYAFIDGTWYFADGGMSAFGMPSTRQPGGLRPLQGAKELTA